MADENVNAQDNTNAVASTEETSETSAESQNSDTNDTLLSEQGEAGASSTEDETGTDKVNTESGDASSETQSDAEGDDGGEKEGGESQGIDYEALEIPEGYTVDFDTYKDELEKAGFNQEQVQTILDMGAKKAKNDYEADQAAFNKVQDEMQKASREDSEFGGVNFEQNLGEAKKALDAFGTPELMEFLQISGAGNHPEVIRAFVKVGKAISEDGLVSPEGGYGTGAPKKEREEVMYPDMVKE